MNGYNFLPLVNWKSEWYQIDETYIKRQYRRHNSDVLSNCPKDKLLVLPTINCGLKIICDFTGDAIPSSPWPHKNKNAKITDEIFKNKQSKLKQAIAKETKESIKNHAMSLLKLTSLVAVGLELFKRRDVLLEYIAPHVQKMVTGPPEC